MIKKIFDKMILFTIIYIVLFIAMYELLRCFSLHFRQWVYIVSAIIIVLGFSIGIYYKIFKSKSKKKKIILSILYTVALLVILFNSYTIFIVAFSYQPEHIVEKDNRKMVAYVSGFLDTSVYYYDYVNPFVIGNKVMEEYYGKGGFDPINNRFGYKYDVVSTTYYDNDGNVINNQEKDKNESNNEIKIQYNVQFGTVCYIKDNLLKVAYSKYEESNFKSIDISNNIKVINYETEKEIDVNNIEIGDYAYVNIPTEFNDDNKTIITIAKKKYIEEKAKEKIIGTNRLDTSVIYYNKDKNYVIVDIPIDEKTINNLYVKACYYMKLNILPTTEIYLDRTATLKEKSDILLNELCWITVNVESIPYLHDNYGIANIEFFGD